MDEFEIPIVLIIFKRVEKTLLILDRIAQVKPKKLYLISDAGRDVEEQEQVVKCREKVEQRIDWDCKIIKHYATENRGCYEQIGLGACWVFSREQVAIFLEDDNLPEISFFYYCKELLYKYEKENKILWICGTNYMKNFKCKSDYVYTQHMLPCGWASWSNKFLEMYDYDFENYNQQSLKEIKQRYASKALYRYDVERWQSEYNRKENGQTYMSWDYHMGFSLRYYDVWGIAPVVNQITNIGIDKESIHGGVSKNLVMTKRFCEIESVQLELPLKEPQKFKLNKKFERKTTKIVLPPFGMRNKIRIVLFIRKELKIPNNTRTVTFLKNKFKNFIGRKNE